LPNRRDRTDEDLSRADEREDAPGDPDVARERFEKARKVLDLEKAEAMWATKPTATIVRS
jgi:hypothetical protein